MPIRNYYIPGTTNFPFFLHKFMVLFNLCFRISFDFFYAIYFIWKNQSRYVCLTRRMSNNNVLFSVKSRSVFVSRRHHKYHYKRWWSSFFSYVKFFVCVFSFFILFVEFLPDKLILHPWFRPHSLSFDFQGLAVWHCLYTSYSINC